LKFRFEYDKLDKNTKGEDISWREIAHIVMPIHLEDKKKQRR